MTSIFFIFYIVFHIGSNFADESCKSIGPEIWETQKRLCIEIEEMGSSSSNSLAGLQDHLKLAREYALEGSYDTSVIFFDGALAQINK